MNFHLSKFGSRYTHILCIFCRNTLQLQISEVQKFFYIKILYFCELRKVFGSGRIAISALAAFSSQAMEIKFYNVPTGMIQFGDSLYCRLESTNRYHSNCIALCILALHDAWSPSGISGASPGSSFDMWICSITVSCSAT